MAGCKKKVKQKEFPAEKHIGQIEDPQKFYNLNPSWNFNNCDLEMWPFTQKEVSDNFWTEILPKLKEWEKQKWSEIFVRARKQNHSIDCLNLSDIAKKRLESKFIEQESIKSLRLCGTHRLYGYIVNGVFNILWCDYNHGDNDTCVCRSKKKHT